MTLLLSLAVIVRLISLSGWDEVKLFIRLACSTPSIQEDVSGLSLA